MNIYLQEMYIFVVHNYWQCHIAFISGRLWGWGVTWPEGKKIHQLPWIWRWRINILLYIINMEEKSSRGWGKKIANWKNNHHVKVSCVHGKVITKSIRLKSSVKVEGAPKILRKTEKKLLNVRIRQCTYTINKLEDKQKRRDRN